MSEFPNKGNKLTVNEAAMIVLYSITFKQWLIEFSGICRIVLF